MSHLIRHRAVLFVTWLVVGSVSLSALITAPRSVERDKIAARLNSTSISLVNKLDELNTLSREDRVEILGRVDAHTKSALWRAHHQRWIDSKVLTQEQIDAVRQSELIVTPEYYTVRDETHQATAARSCRLLTAALGPELKMKLAVDIGSKPGSDAPSSKVGAFLTGARASLSNLLITPLRADPPVCTCNMDTGQCCDAVCRCEGPLSTCGNYLQFGCGCNGLSLCTGYCGCCGCSTSLGGESRR